MSSEWIKREDQEPPQYATPPVEMFIPKEATGHSVDRIIITSEPPCWPEATHWRTHVPPPSMLRIEISEDDARHFSFIVKGSFGETPITRFAEACAKALEAKR